MWAFKIHFCFSLLKMILDKLMQTYSQTIFKELGTDTIINSLNLFFQWNVLFCCKSIIKIISYFPKTKSHAIKTYCK